MKLSRFIFPIVLLAAVVSIGWQVYSRLSEEADTKTAKSDKNRAVPVVTAPIEHGPIIRISHFNATLEANAEFVASPKVGGIIKNVLLNLGDAVSRGQTVATLDSGEFEQAVIQAQAELEVAQANLQEAKSLLTIAERELKRIDQLSERGVSSASQRDAAQAEQLARQAHVKVTVAELARARAQLETTRIRRDYTNVLADWHGDDAQRLVAERYVDEGETVTASTPLLKIVKLNPITAVLHVTEKDYAGLKPGLAVSLTTDAYPGRELSGFIDRISPVFREASRQARVEVQVDNPDLLLKPGMFVRAEVIFEKVDQAVIIPYQALARRDEKTGVFLLSDDGKSVHWKNVTTGIRQGEHQQILNDNLQGEVVILGQQLLKDGSAVIQPKQSQ